MTVPVVLPRRDASGPGTRLLLLAVLMLGSAWPPPAAAQSRADARPPERGFIERTAYWAEQQELFASTGQPLGFYGFTPVIGGIQGGSGPALGLRWDPTLRDPRRLFAVEGSYSLSGYWAARVLAGLTSRRDFAVYGFARHRFMPEEGFYGLGHDTDPAAEADFRLTETVGGVLAGKHLGHPGFVGVHAAFQSNQTGPGHDDTRPNVEQTFGPMPGFGIDPDYVIVGGFAEYDTRDLPFFYDFGRRFAPTEGGLRGFALGARRGLYAGLEVSSYLDVADDAVPGGFSFTEANLELQEFIPIRGGFQGLAFRQALTYAEPHGGDEIPFFMLPTLGGNTSVRGYDNRRFRDRGALLLNAEYRWEVWPFLDLALFGDAGQVFRTASDLALDRFAVSYGIGARFKTPPERRGRPRHHPFRRLLLISSRPRRAGAPVPPGFTA